MRRKRNFGVLLVAMLGLIWGVSTAPSAAASEEATSQVVAAEQSEAAAELAEEAAVEGEEADEAADASKVPWHVLRKLRKIARDIGHVKGRKHRLKTKLAKLEKLPPTSKRRAAAIARTEEELRRERRRLRHLREKRWKLKKEWGLH
jgi:hypothetical protein